MRDRPSTTTFRIGDLVRDRDAGEDSNRMVVLATPSTTVDNHSVNGKTVADYNPEYPAGDFVIEVGYAATTETDVADMDRYAFPASRLKRLPRPGEDADTEDDHE